MDSIFQYGLPRLLPKSPEESFIFQWVSKRPFNLKYVPLRSFGGESEKFNTSHFLSNLEKVFSIGTCTAKDFRLLLLGNVTY